LRIPSAACFTHCAFVIGACQGASSRPTRTWPPRDTVASISGRISTPRPATIQGASGATLASSRKCASRWIASGGKPQGKLVGKHEPVDRGGQSRHSARERRTETREAGFINRVDGVTGPGQPSKQATLATALFDCARRAACLEGGRSSLTLMV
jgi:hypothetical protein